MVGSTADFMYTLPCPIMVYVSAGRVKIEEKDSKNLPASAPVPLVKLPCSSEEWVESPGVLATNGVQIPTFFKQECTLT
jgi:hypothetical protein